jgi:hypothetical protein
MDPFDRIKRENPVLWRKRHKLGRPVVPKWGRVMIGLLVASYLCGVGHIGQVFGATTILTEPFGSSVSRLPEIAGLFPIEEAKARKSELAADLSFQSDEFPLVTTVTPMGLHAPLSRAAIQQKAQRKAALVASY